MHFRPTRQTLTQPRTWKMARAPPSRLRVTCHVAGKATLTDARRVFPLPCSSPRLRPAPRLFRDSEPTPASSHPNLPQFIGRQPYLTDFILVWHFVNSSVQPSVNSECRRGSCASPTNPSPRPPEFIVITDCHRACDRTIRFSCSDRPGRLSAPSRSSLSRSSALDPRPILGASSRSPTKWQPTTPSRGYTAPHTAVYASWSRTPTSSLLTLPFPDPRLRIPVRCRPQRACHAPPRGQLDQCHPHLEGRRLRQTSPYTDSRAGCTKRCPREDPGRIRKIPGFVLPTSLCVPYPDLLAFQEHGFPSKTARHSPIATMSTTGYSSSSNSSPGTRVPRLPQDTPASPRRRKPAQPSPNGTASRKRPASRKLPSSHTRITKSLPCKKSMTTRAR